MVKLKRFFHLLLGTACLLWCGTTPTDAAAESDHLRFTTVKNGLHKATHVAECSVVSATIVFDGHRLRVAEWDEWYPNATYEVRVSWLPKDKQVKNLVKFPVVQAKVTELSRYTLPVKDKCQIVHLEVCKSDLVTGNCVCAVWSPAISEIELWKSDQFYLVKWKEETECVEQYFVKHGSSVVPVAAPSVLLTDVSPCEWNALEVRAVRSNGINTHKAFRFMAHPETATSKCTVHISHEMLEPIVNLGTNFTMISNIGIIETVPANFIECSPTNEVSCDVLVAIASRKASEIVLPKCPGPLCAAPPMCPVRLDDPTDGKQPVGPVRDLHAYTRLDRIVILTWRPPERGDECIKEYLITWSSESHTVDVSNTTYHVTDLEPCMAYNFTVNTIDQSNDKGTPATIMAEVREVDQLSEVTELELYEVEPRSLSVKWKPPVNGTFCVGSYRLAAWYNDPETGEATTVFSNTTDDLHVTFGEVIACMTYTVQVIPISFENKDGRNEIGSLKTKERTILSYHIEPIRAVSVKSRSLQLSTQLLGENNNNCLLVSVRFNCSMVVGGEPVPETRIVKEFVIQGADVSFEGIVEPLMPFSTYQCFAQVQNIAGWSEPTPAYEFQTAEDVPESPSVLKLHGGNRSIVAAWKAPTVKNGVIVRYRIHVRMIEPQYPIPKVCSPIDAYNETVDLRDEVDPEDEANRNWNGAEFEYTISKLTPFTLYTVQIAAATGAGVGPYTDAQEIITQPDVSEAAQNFSLLEVEGPELDKPYRSAATFSWQLPCRLHGKLTRFTGRLEGIRDDNAFPSHSLFWDVIVEGDEVPNETYFFTEDRLLPEYNYTASVSVEVAGIDEHSVETNFVFQSPAGIPSIDQSEKWLDVNVRDAPNPTNTARILLEKISLTADIGSIRYMALLISERLCQSDPEPRTGFINNNGASQWPEVLDWHRVNNMRCIEQYQTTPEFWNPMAARSRPADPQIEYVIGRERCDDGKKYCNGPLKPGTEYALIVRIFSRSGFTDSAVQRFQTDSLIQVALIVSTVVACLLLAFIGGLLVLWRKQRLLLPTQLSGRAPTEEPSDIPLKNFPSQYDELFQSNREKVSKEFQAINYFCDVVLQETVSFFSAKENERKNRYVNILPFDSNRVLLDTDEEEEEISANDYINASFVEGYKYQREYIATQGPKPDTCHDFWRMVLQYEIESIVMLTQPIDHDKNKCCQYYPLFNQSVDYGDIQVRCTQEMNLSLYYKRLFLVSKGNQSKAVFHYHFLDWPDHSCPASPADLIKFSKIIRSERKSYAIPLVVHCSAGVGRTGTFIALDIILQRMQNEKKINVYDTVKRLRRQRVKMVQTLDQYAFLYQCCLEFVSKINRKKPKTSNGEAIGRGECEKRHPDMIVEVDNVALHNGDKPMFNIKFPKSVNPGLGEMASFAPNDIESGKW